MPIITKQISIEDFKKLYDDIYNKQWNKIAPNLANELKKIWIVELMNLFQNAKTEGSYGEISFTDLENIVKEIGETEDVKLDKMEYPYDNYVEAFPYTYKKYGHLEQDIRSSNESKEVDSEGKLSVSISIPKYYPEDPHWNEFPEAYMYLEEQRSFVKASFLLAWPKMLRKICEKIAESK